MQHYGGARALRSCVATHLIGARMSAGMSVHGHRSVSGHVSGLNASTCRASAERQTNTLRAYFKVDGLTQELEAPGILRGEAVAQGRDLSDVFQKVEAERKQHAVLDIASALVCLARKPLHRDVVRRPGPRATAQVARELCDVRAVHQHAIETIRQPHTNPGMRARRLPPVRHTLDGRTKTKCHIPSE